MDNVEYQRKRAWSLTPGELRTARACFFVLRKIFQGDRFLTDEAVAERTAEDLAEYWGYTDEKARYAFTANVGTFLEREARACRRSGVPMADEESTPPTQFVIGQPRGGKTLDLALARMDGVLTHPAYKRIHRLDGTRRAVILRVDKDHERAFEGATLGEAITAAANELGV